MRDYGLPGSIWEHPDTLAYRRETGDDAVLCKHEWGETLPEHHPGQVSDGKWQNNEKLAKGQTAGAGQFCQRCGAWRGCLGLEPTPELFVEHLVQVFREVRRVLRDDGVAWVNLGDTYAGGGRGGNSDNITGRGKNASQCSHFVPNALKVKDLCGIPWRVAFALQADGWWLRNDIIWHKPNPMPESVRDRCTVAHEYLFLLSKSARYFYDQDAIREPQTGNAHSRGKGNESFNAAMSQYVDVPGGRNRSTVWTIPAQTFKLRDDLTEEQRRYVLDEMLRRGAL